MASQAVQPLRIQKSTPTSSPTKLSKAANHRPLTELSPMEKRRNSPSFNQASKKPMFTSDSSPFDPTPYDPAGGISPRLFWKGRESRSPQRFSTENSPFSQRDTSPSPTRRTSIEHLKKASRVKNSSMFAREHQREYDPAWMPTVERPLAPRNQMDAEHSTHLNADQDQEHAYATRSNESPSRSNSPTKSSLSKKSRYAQSHGFDPENDLWSEDESGEERKLPPGRVLHRHAKSVTFDVKPPQVNEYEMRTPDLSSVGTASREGSYDSSGDVDEEGDSFGGVESFERDDSFDASLEDTAKTPVVGPEDWRFMSPAGGEGNQEEVTIRQFTNVQATQSPATAERPSIGRSNSDKSDADTRPLPPVPSVGSRPSSSHSGSGLSAAAERASSAQRSLPSPPAPVSVTKSDIQGIGSGKMTLEERLKLMMVHDSDQTVAEIQRERRMRRGQSPNKTSKSPEIEEQIQIEVGKEDTQAGTETIKTPSRISRESILRKVHGQNKNFDDMEFNYSSPFHSSLGERSPMPIDPDTPIPTTEIAEEDNFPSPQIKREPSEESEVDVYSIPEMYSSPRQARFEDYSSYSEDHLDVDQNKEEDDGSHYSRESVEKDETQHNSSSATDDSGPTTPRATSPASGPTEIEKPSPQEPMELPDFAAFISHNDFDLGLRTYSTPSPEPQVLTQGQTSTPGRESGIERPSTPEAQMTKDFSSNGQANEPDTPESVIRHPPSNESSKSPAPRRTETPLSPGVPEPIATVKASGSRLKTRPSATPADLAAMSAARRQISSEHRPGSSEIPPVPARHHDRPSLGDVSGVEDNTEAVEASPPDQTAESGECGVLRRKSLVKLSVPTTTGEEDLSFGLDKEFDRLMDAKKKGYLMRQNTKVIVASSTGEDGEPKNNAAQKPGARAIRSAGSSPVKGSHTPSQSWSVEPWNGKMRRKSIRDASGNVRKKAVPGPAPPLPGQESNVAATTTAEVEEETVEDGNGEDERGRLFVKCVGVKHLNLPLPQNEKTWFRLTLDNGVHCVTTAWLELGKNAPVGQEFELVVMDELEFTLTLETKLEPPKGPASTSSSPTKIGSPKKSTFSRVFGSPKKRKEAEKRYEEEQRAAEQNAHTKRMSVQPTAWDLMHHLVAHGDKSVEDGTFGRAYVSLREHEGRAFGRPYTVDIPCFNEWATDPNPTNTSLRTKQGGVQRKAPYRIGKLELQLLYVPKPKGATDDDMPKSLNACVRQMKEAETNASRKWEGHLSQQGGDCPYWRRRFFKLDGVKLTAYHEATHQPRATINISKASKLIDDRSSLMQKEKSSKGRRKSAFAEEEEGYMFVEEGFRMRFANGEVIDFYADSAAEKDGWMKVLGETIGKDNGNEKSWTKIVLAREKKSKELRTRTSQPMVSAPSTPQARPRSTFIPASTTAVTPGSGAQAPSQGLVAGRRQPPAGGGYQTRVNGFAPRSMIF